MQAIAGPESAFNVPFVPYSFFASMLPWTGWVGGQNWVCPRARETPRNATAHGHSMSRWT